MSNPSDVDSERLALVHKQAGEVMKRCDELIERVEEELTKFVAHRGERRAATAVAGCKAGHFSFVSMTDPPSSCRPVANSN